MAPAPAIDIARAYDVLPTGNKIRLLVDRIWPRGVSRNDLHLDDWIRDVAPSNALRKWFGHDPDRWKEFRQRYRAELDHQPDAVGRCLAWCLKGPVVLIYGARDRDHNQAVVLREYLQQRMQHRR